MRTPEYRSIGQPNAVSVGPARRPSRDRESISATRRHEARPPDELMTENTCNVGRSPVAGNKYYMAQEELNKPEVAELLGEAGVKELQKLLV